MSHNEIIRLQIIGTAYEVLASTPDASHAKWLEEVWIPFLESKSADEVAILPRLF